MSCLAETCAHWTGFGCVCSALDVEPECVPCLIGETCDDHAEPEGGGQVAMDGLAPCVVCGLPADDCADLNANDNDACCSGCRHPLGRREDGGQGR